MKNKLISCAMVMAVLAAPVTAWAQVGGGIKAGANFARVTGADDDDIGDRIGFVAGLFLTTNQGLFAAQPEVVLSMQGSKFSFGRRRLTISRCRYC
jgi:hypothetical protein